MKKTDIMFLRFQVSSRHFMTLFLLMFCCLSISAKTENDSTSNQHRDMPHYGHYLSASFNFFGLSGIQPLTYGDNAHSDGVWMNRSPGYGPIWQLDYYWLPKHKSRRPLTFGPGVRYTGFNSSGKDRFLDDDIVWDSKQSLTLNYLAPQVIMKILTGPDRWSFNVQLGCGIAQSIFSGHRFPVSEQALKEKFRTIKYGFSWNYSVGIELHINYHWSFITDISGIQSPGLRHVMKNDAIPIHQDMKSSHLQWFMCTFGLRYRF